MRLVVVALYVQSEPEKNCASGQTISKRTKFATYVPVFKIKPVGYYLVLFKRHLFSVPISASSLLLLPF